MPDEDVTANGDTTQQAADTTDWQKRYGDLQPQYTRTTQELAAERAIWDDENAVLARLREKHPGMFEDDEPDPNPAIPEALQQTQAELAEMRAWKAEVQADRDRQARENGRVQWEAEVNSWAKDDGVKLNEDDLNAIAWKAAQQADPVAATRGIYDARVAAKKAERETWEAEQAEARKRPRVPHTVAGGTTATGTKAWSEMSEKEALEAQVEMYRGLTTQ